MLLVVVIVRFIVRVGVRAGVRAGVRVQQPQDRHVEGGPRPGSLEPRSIQGASDLRAGAGLGAGARAGAGLVQIAAVRATYIGIMV